MLKFFHFAFLDSENAPTHSGCGRRFYIFPYPPFQIPSIFLRLGASHKLFSGAKGYCHAQNEDSQRNQKAFPADGFRAGETPPMRHQPLGLSHVEEAATQSSRHASDEQSDVAPNSRCACSHHVRLETGTFVSRGMADNSPRTGS
jgi:hypothetical protein